MSWALGDATAKEGGCFVCIPGGHKARYPYPGGGSSTTAIDGPSVKHISVEAGDGELKLVGAAHQVTI